MKEQKLKIQVKHTLTYDEGVDADEGIFEGWTEEEDLLEFGGAFPLSSDGKKFVIQK